jgi:DNA polymerase-3 subunit gamma/tau
MTLYLKYRSKTLDELDIKEVRESLKKIVSSGKIPHAFLFSGPKGTGKTSAARILAKIVNCESTSQELRGPGKVEPCNKCGQCESITNGNNIDVIELDAASNRGIDDIRALRDAIKLSPARAKKKVYIIDEAHMLTTEASNALLKTLEEPPEHVIFILATTNPEKLIDTIRSRATNINFRKAAKEEIVRSLKRVVDGEKITIDEEALLAIAKASDGSFRDAVKILEQISLEVKRLSREEVEEYLFSRRVFGLDELLKLLSERDTKEALQIVETAVSQGVSVKSIINLMTDRLRSGLLAEVGLAGDKLLYFTKEELVDLLRLIQRVWKEMPMSVLEQIPLEIAIVEWGEGKSNIKKQILKVKNEDKESNKKAGIKTDTVKKEMAEVLVESALKLESTDGQVGDGQELGRIEEVWGRVLTEIRPRNTSTEALLRASKPLSYDGKKLTLGVYYRFHKERLEANPHRDILEATIASILGNHVRVSCILTEPPVRQVAPAPSQRENSSSSGTVLTESDSVLTETNDEDIIRVAKDIFESS